MFSSNQVLEISGSLSNLESALNFVIDYSGYRSSFMCYQITEDGKFCIGWGNSDKKQPYGNWKKFEFDYDSLIVSRIIIQFLEKQEYNKNVYDCLDGSTDSGFLMKAIPETFSEEENGIKDPFYGIVSFEPFVNYCSK